MRQQSLFYASNILLTKVRKKWPKSADNFEAICLDVSSNHLWYQGSPPLV